MCGVLTRLLAPFVARERLRDEVAALVTRVTQLERERSALALEHAERVSALDALVRRLSARVQRAEALVKPQETEERAEGHSVFSPRSQSVLDHRRAMRGY